MDLATLLLLGHPLVEIHTSSNQGAVLSTIWHAIDMKITISYPNSTVSFSNMSTNQIPFFIPLLQKLSLVSQPCTRILLGEQFSPNIIHYCVCRSEEARIHPIRPCPSGLTASAIAYYWPIACIHASALPSSTKAYPQGCKSGKTRCHHTCAVAGSGG